MQSKRLDRVGHLIQMELSESLQRRVKDPRIGMVTITHVSVAPDLRSARVFYSCLSDEASRAECQKGLEKAAGFLQHRIAETIEIRYTPKLTFSYDITMDKTIEMDRIFKDLQDDTKSS